MENNKCRCDFRTKLAGDGCEFCNPELARQLKEEEIVDEMREALEAIEDLAGWHTDDEADPNDTSPSDMTAFQNGLIRQRCRKALECLKKKS